LSDASGVSVGADSLLITGGNSMAISLMARVFATKGSQQEQAKTVVFLEDPTYFLVQI
jgi:DNA-binding transcriptional MocR family regulator